MRNVYQFLVKVLMVGFFASTVFAQEQSAEAKKETATAETKKEVEAPVQKTEPKTEAAKAPPAKKMVQDATINLQTTITGNQEQPRVLYILPWQSPQTADVDFEPLDNQQKAVFGHIEREELRRELESAGELQ